MNSRILLNDLFKNARTYSAVKGQLLLEPGEEPRGVYFLTKGAVKVYDIDAAGNSQLLTVVGKGEIFPLYWALGEKHQALFVEAICPLQFKLLSQRQFKLNIKAEPKYNDAIVRELLRSYRTAQQRIQNLEYRTAQERLAFRLLFLGQRFGIKRKGQYYLEIPVTYPDLAASINMTRETVNRTMKEFLEKDIVSYRAHKLIINRPEVLQNILGTENLLNNLLAYNDAAHRS